MATAPKAAAKAEEAEEAPKPKKSKKKLIMFLLIFIAVAGIGGGGAWFFMGGGEEAPVDGADPAAPKEVKKINPKDIKPPVFLVFEPFTVNLQPDGAGEQFLQVSFSMQVEDQGTVDTIKIYLPQVRSRLLLLLSGKKASQISTPDGKKKLAEEIIDQVKQPLAPGLPPQTVMNVYFTSFVIQ